MTYTRRPVPPISLQKLTVEEVHAACVEASDVFPLPPKHNESFRFAWGNNTLVIGYKYSSVVTGYDLRHMRSVAAFIWTSTINKQTAPCSHVERYHCFVCDMQACASCDTGHSPACVDGGYDELT